MRCILLARETESFLKNALWTSVVQARKAICLHDLTSQLAHRVFIAKALWLQ